MESSRTEATGTDLHSLRVATSFAAFTPDEWNGLSGTSRGTRGEPYNPFLSHAFLSALEDSGCASAASGWHPRHLRLETEGGRLQGAVLCYAKTHSQGEYVFDHGWADAFERAGGRYYPKLQASVPFTPATGPRLLHVRADANAAAHVRSALAHGLKGLADRVDASSAHVTFATGDDMAALADAGFMERNDQQFHFVNEGYASYDAFLETLASRKRKALRRERRDAVAGGIEIRWLTGREIREADWDTFFAFYMDTGARKWGRPYLNREFFSMVGERMCEDILLIFARRGGRDIAGALNFVGADTLYGRYWGCTEDHPFLHFEICYHQAIDFAIARGLRVVEAGAQGEHKLARGYRPVTTRSAHHIVHPGLRKAVADYLGRERREIAEIGAYLAARAPFRRDEEGER